MTPFDDLRSYVALPRVTGLRLSPDGTWLAATVQQPDPDGKKFISSIWRIPADGPDGQPPGQATRLTQSAQGEDGPAFLPDGSLLFASKRPDLAAGSADQNAGRPRRTAPGPRCGCCPRPGATPDGSSLRLVVPAGSSRPVARQG